MAGWTHQPVTFFGSCKGLSLDANQSPHHWPWESAFRWIKRRAFWWFGRSHLTTVISARNDLEGQLWLSLGYVAYDDYFQGLYIVSNCSCGRSPQRGFAEINHAALQILTWMSALPGAYCECADELRESHPLLSGPVVAPVFGEPCSWCPCAPLDFWLSEQTAAGKRKRQVVCKILGEAEGNWEVNIKKL